MAFGFFGRAEDHRRGVLEILRGDDLKAQSKNPKATLNKKTLSGFFAKQNRVGYSLVDIIVKLYSHSFQKIIAGFS
jgi:hypothetical protein